MTAGGRLAPNNVCEAACARAAKNERRSHSFSVAPPLYITGGKKKADLNHLPFGSYISFSRRRFSYFSFASSSAFLKSASARSGKASLREL